MKTFRLLLNKGARHYNHYLIALMNELPYEIHGEIARSLDLRTAGIVSQLNTYWHKLINLVRFVTSVEMTRRKRICSLRKYNPLLKIIQHVNRENEWPWGILSGSSYITPEYIENNPQLPWLEQQMATNPNFPPAESMKINSYMYVKYNTNARFHEMVLAGLSKLITMPFLPDVTIDTVVQYYANDEIDWNWCSLSCNLNITLEILKKHGDLPWNWDSMSENQTLTFDIVLAFPHVQWNWYHISSHKMVTVDIVHAHPELSWCWEGILHNPNITLETIMDDDVINKIFRGNSIVNASMVCKYNNANPNVVVKSDGVLPDINVQDYWASISHNPAISIKDVLMHPNAQWNWTGLTYNKNISLEDIEQNPGLPWDYEALFYNLKVFDDKTL